MKKFSRFYLTAWLICALFFYNNSYSQSASKSDFDNLMVSEFCDSFTKVSSHITTDNMAGELSNMIIPIINKYKSEINSEWGLDINKKDDFQKAGEKIGGLAALKCPAFTQFVKGNMNEIMAEHSAAFSKIYIGKILKIEGQSFAYLLVQNNQGKTEKIYWLGYFEGSNKLISQASFYLNKPATISYTEREVYQIAEKQYKTIKVVTKVQF